MSQPWRIELLGRLRVLRGERELTQLGSRKAAGLLAYLAYFPRPHARDYLIEIYWPDGSPQAARHNLSVELSRLRSHLEDPENALLLADRTFVSLAPQAVTTDVAQLEAALAAAERAEDPTAQRSFLQQAVELYGGDLLPGHSEAWVLQERGWLAERYFQALHQLLLSWERAGEPLSALEAARRGVRMDPLREEAHRDLMRLQAAGGDRAAALRQYRELERLLKEDLATEPEAATRELARAIEEQRYSATVQLPAAGDEPPRAKRAGSPPRGPVAEGSTATWTFLLTDIEGSTRLWREQPEAMRQALARHDALLVETIEGHRGTVLKQRGEGDSAFAVFARATDAVTAASALQRALACEPWPAEVRLQVRVALHTGEAELRGGDYYGLAVNQCARLRAVGHGGQTLLSQSTAALVRDALPEGLSLRDLGTHRLKDQQRAEPIFQMEHSVLAAEFPPLRSLEAFAHNLPLQLTRFIGREEEIAAVKGLLQSTRLLTLTGAGGCGKTRLALQVAADLLPEYSEGVWLVELAGLSDQVWVPQTVAAALGVREEPGRPLLTTLLDTLRSRSLLLVLDNCEHLLPACAQLAESLLRGCANVRVLATSREGLGIAGEQSYRVPPLSMPDADGRASAPESLTQYEAVQLFLDRVRLSQPTFTITHGNAAAVAQLCRRLDGMPLAIELAAARVKALPVEKLNERLDDMFRLLTGGSRTALPRQQTLRALIDWSYDLLSPAERELLRRLSVFAGGWTLEAAEAVCAGEGVEEWEVLDLLTSLVEKSLVLYEERDGKGRYRLLETVRQYGRDRLLEAGEVEPVRGRHLDFFRDLAGRAEPELHGPEQVTWLDCLDADHDNLRAALVWSVEGRQIEGGLELGGALWRFWSVRRDHVREGRERLAELLMLSSACAPSAARAKALHGAGVMATDQSDYGAARSLLEESLAIWRGLGDVRGIANALNNLGIVMSHRGEFGEAWVLYEESLVLRRQLGDKRGIAWSLHNLGNIALYRGDLSTAQSLHEESLALRKEIGDRRGISISLNYLGDVLRCRGDVETARAFYTESLSLREELRDKAGIAESLCNLGHLAKRQAEYASAQALYKKSLILRQEFGHTWGIAACLHGLAGVARAQGRTERAVRLFGAAAALWERLGTPVPSVYRADDGQDLLAARAALGEELFATAWAEGQVMSLGQAADYALVEQA